MKDQKFVNSAETVLALGDQVIALGKLTGSLQASTLALMRGAASPAWGDLDGIVDKIGEWGDRTFPNRSGSYEGLFAHLKDEVDELAESLAEDEAADVFILLAHFCHRRGFSLSDAVRDKFAVVQKRRWAPPDERGVRRHIEEEGEN